MCSEESLVCQIVFKPLNSIALTDIPCPYYHLSYMFCLSPQGLLFYTHLTICSFPNLWLKWTSATCVSSRFNCYYPVRTFPNFSLPETCTYISPPVSLKSYIMPKKGRLTCKYFMNDWMHLTRVDASWCLLDRKPIREFTDFAPAYNSQCCSVKCQLDDSTQNYMHIK